MQSPETGLTVPGDVLEVPAGFPITRPLFTHNTLKLHLPDILYGLSILPTSFLRALPRL